MVQICDSAEMAKFPEHSTPALHFVAVTQGNSPKAQNEHVSSQITPRLHRKLHG